MRRVTRLLGAWLLGMAAFTAPVPSYALSKPKVDWVQVAVPDEGEASARRLKVFREALKQATKRTNFGKARGTVALSAKVVEFSSEVHGGVLRVRCTVKGRVAGGAGARSRIAFGGSPNQPEALEKEVLTMVANGLVARLAQIARTQGARVMHEVLPGAR